MTPDPEIVPPAPALARDLTQLVPPLAADATCERARDLFTGNTGIFAVAVVDEAGRPVGLINRFKFLERLAATSGQEFVLRRPVTALMEEECLVLDESTQIDELGSRLLAQQHRYLLDGFIVTRGGAYAGIGTGLDLIRALTDRRHAELRQMALHDMLTGLPNRSLFESRLTEELSAAEVDGSKVAVLFLDLDRFKEINDSFGHRFGDLVLCGVGQRLRAGTRSSDIVARLSGDEFAIVLPRIRDAADAGAIAGVLLGSCSAPLGIDGREAIVSCSIGVALCPDHGTTRETLLRAADTAQFLAKESRNSWQMYHPEMEESRSPIPGLSALRHALDHGQLTVHYQPIVALATNRVCTVEALVRWPNSGVSATDMVNLAETSGLIMPLTEFVMRTSFLQLKAWDRVSGRTDLRMAVNISAVQFQGPALLDMIDRLIEETGIEPTRLDLELTERAAMRASAAVQASFDAMQSRGITLTLDDFGTGYSALSRLERLPMDAMKIDKSFLERVEVEGNGVVARAIIAMGRALGMTIVGEGVETPGQLEFLRSEGCEYAQGYYLGVPCEADALTPMLTR